MSTKAYVLIEVAVGKTKDVIAALQQVEGVMSVEAVTGPYDVIAIMEGQDINSVGDLVTKGVHSISGVSRTVTCLAMKLG